MLCRPSIAERIWWKFSTCPVMVLSCFHSGYHSSLTPPPPPKKKANDGKEHLAQLNVNTLKRLVNLPPTSAPGGNWRSHQLPN